jgi:hypothetical protein
MALDLENQKLWWLEGSPIRIAHCQLPSCVVRKAFGLNSTDLNGAEKIAVFNDQLYISTGASNSMIWNVSMSTMDLTPFRNVSGSLNSLKLYHRKRPGKSSFINFVVHAAIYVDLQGRTSV